VTTAHDLTILGRAVEERFPRYFHYFSTAAFQYDGEVIGNHNHLLGRVDGVDGIKTGYTQASGFNLLTSVHRDGRSLIAVVMGGRSAGARDRIMQNLIADHIAEASTSRSATMIADAAPDERAAAHEEPPASERAAAAPQRVAERDAQSATGEGDNADGDDVAQQNGAPAAAATSLAYASPPSPGPASADPGRVERRGLAAAPKKRLSNRLANASASVPPPERPQGGKPDRQTNRQKWSARTTTLARAQSQAPDAGEDHGRGGSAAPGSWMIQIGASDDPAKANALLIRARERNRSTLAAAKPVTEPVRRGDGTLYRARFAMLDSASAESACRSLKHNGFSCFPAHD
jgi:D-alanyl-D-alanine carboxypeptidase